MGEKIKILEQHNTHTLDCGYDLEKIKIQIEKEFDWIDHSFIEEEEIVIEEYYEMSEDEKNSDDCCDQARENGKMIVERFPMLEISNYYCHRSKYAIVHFKMRRQS